MRAVFKQKQGISAQAKQVGKNYKLPAYARKLTKKCHSKAYKLFLEVRR